MLSETELHRLVSDISNQTSRASAASQERIASSRNGMALDAELKAMTEQAIAASGEALARVRD